MSENDDVTSQAQQHSHGKQRLKRCVLRRLWKTGSDCVDVTCCGRLFQTRAAATGKLDHRRLITAYDGWLAITTRRDVVDIVLSCYTVHAIAFKTLTLFWYARTFSEYFGQVRISRSSDKGQGHGSKKVYKGVTKHKYRCGPPSVKGKLVSFLLLLCVLHL